MDYKDILRYSSEIESDVIGFRRHIHANAELSFEEFATADYIASQLDAAGITYERVCGTGVVARVDGRTSSNQCVVLRADTDALPIVENTGLKYSSVNHGVMHACGHDMHTAVLLGTLKVLQSHREEFDGSIVGLFQPAEEKDPGGASFIVREKILDRYRPLMVIGAHVSADMEVGKIGFHEGNAMASGDEVHIRVIGKGGHAAMPDRVIDPITTASQMITALQQVVSRNSPPLVPTVLSFGRFIADGATNIIPDSVELAGTLRTLDEKWRNEAKHHIRRTAEGICAAFGATAEIDIRDGYPCVYNDPTATRMAAHCIGELLGTDSIVWQPQRLTAEDFGYYTHIWPSVFYRVGIGAASGNSHNPKFNPDERALRFGVAAMTAIAIAAAESR